MDFRYELTSNKRIKMTGHIARDFIQRCNDYEICDVSVPKPGDDEDEGQEANGAAAAGRPGPPDLARMNREREEKIRRYRQCGL